MTRKRSNAKSKTQLEETVLTFDNIRLEVQRSNLAPRYQNSQSSIYLLGENGAVLAQSLEGERLHLVDNDEQEYYWGCVKPVLYDKDKRSLKSRLDVRNNKYDPTSFTTTPTIGYTPVVTSGGGRMINITYQLICQRHILGFRLLNQQDLDFIEEARIDRMTRSS